MKLLFCTECSDVRKLHLGRRVYCKCRRVWGKYVDMEKAEVSRNALVIGMGNGYLAQAAHAFRANAPDDITTSHGSSGYGVKTWLFSKSGAPNVTWVKP